MKGERPRALARLVVIAGCHRQAVGSGAVLVRYRYRLYPSPGQRQGARPGCSAVPGWCINDSLRLREQCHAAGEKISDSEVQRRVVTLAKSTPERAWLAEVSSIALMQACHDARRAYRNWFDSLSGRRKGRKVGHPVLRRKRGRQSVRLTRYGFRLHGQRLYVAKVDPQKGADEYASYIDQLAYAEKLGFDIIAVNEHHQTAYGMMPAPDLIASALIQRTKKVKIAILGRALPLVNNPVNIAEEFAMLDNLSKGRIITGFVRGIGNEYHSTGINPYFSHERYQEAHDLIVAAGQSPARFHSRASTTISATSIYGRDPISSRIRRSRFRRKAPARPSAGRRRCVTPIARRSVRSPRWRNSSSSTATRRTRPATRRRPTELGLVDPHLCRRHRQEGGESRAASTGCR